MKALLRAELRTIQHLMNDGLTHAARSFSQMVGQEISVSMPHCVTDPTVVANAIDYSSATLTRLVTHIMGELPGLSYLLLSEYESSTLQRTCLPTSLGTDEQVAVGRAFLEEIDNVISAAVITRLSEALDAHMYGGVPHWVNQPKDLIRDSLKKDLAQLRGGRHLRVYARFHFEEDPLLQPQFLWVLSPEFLRRATHCLNSAPSDISP